MYLIFATIGLGVMILATYAFHCQSQTYKIAENKVQQKQSLTRKKNCLQNPIYIVICDKHIFTLCNYITNAIIYLFSKK